MKHMKTLISFTTFILIVSVGIASFILFRQSEYVLSGLLTIAGFLSLNAWIYFLPLQKEAALHQGPL